LFELSVGLLVAAAYCIGVAMGTGSRPWARSGIVLLVASLTLFLANASR